MAKSLTWVVIIALFGGFVYIAADILMPFIIGFILAYLFSPLVRYFEERFKIQRWVIALCIVLCLVLLFVSFWTLLAPVIYHQISTFIDYIPTHKPVFIKETLQVVDSYLDDSYKAKLSELLNNLFTEISKILVSAVDKVWHSGLVFVNGIITLVVVPLITFYFIKDWNRFYLHVEKLVPVKRKKDLNELLGSVNSALAGFIRGQLNVCMVLAFYYSIALYVIGLNFGALIGITTGFLAFIPFLGVLSGFIAALTVALFQYHALKGFFLVGLVFFGGNTLESVIGPRWIGNKIGVSPVWIVFFVLLGGSLFNFVGVFLAVPICAVTSVMIKFALKKYYNSALYKS